METWGLIYEFIDDGLCVSIGRNSRVFQVLVLRHIASLSLHLFPLERIIPLLIMNKDAVSSRWLVLKVFYEWWESLCWVWILTFASASSMKVKRLFQVLWSIFGWDSALFIAHCWLLSGISQASWSRVLFWSSNHKSVVFNSVSFSSWCCAVILISLCFLMLCMFRLIREWRTLIIWK